MKKLPFTSKVFIVFCISYLLHLLLTPIFSGGLYNVFHNLFYFQYTFSFIFTIENIVAFLLYIPVIILLFLNCRWAFFLGVIPSATFVIKGLYLLIFYSPYEFFKVYFFVFFCLHVFIIFFCFSNGILALAKVHNNIFDLIEGFTFLGITAFVLSFAPQTTFNVIFERYWYPFSLIIIHGFLAIAYITATLLWHFVFSKK